MKLKIDNKIGVGEIIALIAIIFSIIAFSRSCKIEKKLKNQDFIIRANQYRPHITAIGEPQLIKFSMTIDKIIKTDTGAKIEGSVNYSAYLNLKNIGNSKANIQVIILTDTLTFRESLRDEVFCQKTLKIENGDNKYTNRKIEIFPNETKKIEISRKLTSHDNHLFNLHIIIYYSNDLLEINNLFDTYLWYEYSLTDSFLLEEDMQIYEGLEISIPLSNIILIDSNKSSKVYEKDELNKFIQTYKSEISDSIFFNK